MGAGRFDRQALVDAGPALHAHETEVAFQHVDAAGIVFFARVLDYFHDAYVDLLARVGYPLPRWLAEGDVIAPLTHAEADYLAPLRFGDRVEVQLVALELAGSRVTLGWRVVPVDGGPVRAVGQTVHVFVDRSTFRRAPLPAPLEEALRALSAA